MAATKTLEFIESQLAAWRDDPERPKAEAERQLNSQLCAFLNVAARQSDFAMVHFHHEEPQGTRHAVDLAASLVEGGWIEGKQYTKYEPIVVVEGKRLPTPGSGRQREYVSSPQGNKAAGGVQRFKLGHHGATVRVAGMVGYVQRKTCDLWFTTINVWIEELALSSDSLWSRCDLLTGLNVDSHARVSRCESEHARRSTTSPVIRLTHLWLEM